jgi:uncharacterized Rossmann fold enzyme
MEPTRLDPTAPQKVSYCIPLPLRDEQVKLAIARTTRRLQRAETLSDEPVAIVGYGPSLRETWEELRQFTTIFSCSGAHRFLIDREIIPTYQVAVDPLPKNTVRLIGAPHKAVQYLICSTCHPDVFDHLEGYDVTLWHCFAAEEEAQRILPHGEWALTGGPDVGLRSIAVARFLGFRNLHIFGMDGSAPTHQGRHAGEHPNPLQPTWITEYEGRTFQTTPSMLEAARLVEHELQQLPDVKATFYGDGLIQHMAKFFKPVPQVPTLTAYSKLELISDEMRALNAKLHQQVPEYGMNGGRHAPIVLSLVETLKKASPHGIPSVLDYGCGKGGLGRALPFPIFEYDPAIPGKQENPRPADLVICTDVLEHIEPDKVVLVLKDLHRCTKQTGYFVIHTGPAKKIYADGRNTHLTQRGLDWWRAKLGKFFTIGKIWPMGPELHVLVAPKSKDALKTPQLVVKNPHTGGAPAVKPVAPPPAPAPAAVPPTVARYLAAPPTVEVAE